MNKTTRFQLPPRAESAAGVDRWVTGGSAVAAPMGLASGRSTDASTSLQFPFMFDMAALLAAQRRNMEAITAANRVVLEAAQSVAQQNVKVWQRAIDGVSGRLQTMANPEGPRDRAMRQTETAIKAYEDALSNMREIGAIIQQANGEAMDVLTRRFTEAADEVKSLARHAAASI
jgi:phasin family protein